MKAGPFSSDLYEQNMVSRLIAEQRAFDRANAEQRSETANKIIAYFRNGKGMSKRRLCEIYGADMVNAVLNDESEKNVIPLNHPAVLKSKEPLSATGARMLRRRVGARS